MDMMENRQKDGLRTPHLTQAGVLAPPSPAQAPSPPPPGKAHPCTQTEPSLVIPAGIINFDLCRPFRKARDDFFHP